MKKKGLFLGILFFAFLVLFTGCGKKKAITSDTFKEKAEASGYTIIDANVQYAAYGYVKEAYIARSDNGYQIEFYVFEDGDYAKGMFNTNKEIIENINGINKMKTEVNLANYNKFSVTTDNTYGYLSRIDNTLVYINTTKENKKEISKFLKKINY